MKRRTPRYIAAALVLIVGALTPYGSASAQAAPAPKSDLAGLATVSGTVAAPAPFTAAKVYFRNVEKRMQYMVYTAGGKYTAMHLFPGKYEMRVEARGLESAVTQVTLNAGANPPANAMLNPVSDAGTQIVTMNEM